MVSVIVPIYNCEKYLQECIESILAQTYTDWEMILVDDGSTDSSGRIADSYAATDPRIRVAHFANGGLSAARNKGIELAQGEYITFVDADDALFPDAVMSLKNAADRNGADISSGEFRHDKRRGGKGNEKVFSPEDAVADTLYQTTLLPSAWGKLYNAKLFSEIRYTEGLYYEDLDLFYHVFLKANRIVHIFEPVYFYRMTTGSILHTWDKRRLDVLEVTRKIEDFMTRNYPKLVAPARDRRLSANFNIFALASIHGEKDVAGRCWEIVKAYRRQSLENPKVRLKNKVGILLSYLGKETFAFVGKFVYRH